jgi:hypothetical protein
MPPSVLVAIVGVVVSIGLVVVPVFFQPPATARTELVIVIGVSIAVALMVSALPLLIVWGLWSGWKSAPFLVSVLGLWTIPQVFAYPNILAMVSGAAALAAVVAAWLPSARRYGAERRAR